MKTGIKELTHAVRGVCATVLGVPLKEQSCEIIDIVLALASAITSRESDIRQLRAILEAHHQWHLDNKDQSYTWPNGTVGHMNLGQEYMDSKLFEDTHDVLYLP